MEVVTKKTRKTNPQISEKIQEISNQQKRIFSSQKEFMHDLYKFEVAKFKKNIAIDGFEPEYVDAEHVHFFHSITSDGKPQTRTNSVGGHFHKVKLTPQPGGLPPLVECESGPMREVVKLKHGKRVKTEIPFNDVDTHTHSVKYEKSNVIVERVRNIEAAKAEATIQARFQGANTHGIVSNDE